jgi:hypothetical protein
VSELPEWIQERIKNSAISQLSETMRTPRVCPVCMADSMVDSEAKYRQFMAGTEAIPGRDYDCTECGSVWSVPLAPRSGKLPPLICPTCVTDPAIAVSTVFWEAAQRPGVSYRCGHCGCVWSLPPALELASFQSIDWSQPQPAGVYRCQEGWSDTSGTEYGCNKRGITECSDGNLRCTDHALIFELIGIRQVMSLKTDHDIEQTFETHHRMECLVDAVEEVSTALWEINYSHMSLSRKVWYWFRGWMRERRVQRPTRNS